MASVLLNTKVPQKVCFYLIDDEIKLANKIKITETVQKLQGNIEFVKIKNNDLANCYVSGELSRASYFRLDIANILSESVERIIYWIVIFLFMPTLLKCGILICRANL